MAIPTFNSFSFNDGNFITERITFRGFGTRNVIKNPINRREGIKLNATEFSDKQVVLEGWVVADSPTSLQTLLDNMKASLTYEEGSLIVETGRTFRATTSDLDIPDEHFNQSKVSFVATFVCSDPFSTGSAQTVIQTFPSGITNLSGFVNISGSFFVRPTLVITPPAGVGHTNIRRIVVTHVPTGQTVTISGFGNGTDLAYGSTVTVNFDNFITTENSTVKSNAGSFARWQPSSNNYLVTVSGNWVGGSVSLSYSPRYL